MNNNLNKYNDPFIYANDDKKPNSVSLVKGDGSSIPDKTYFDGDYRITTDKTKAKVGDIVCIDEVMDNDIWYFSPAAFIKEKAQMTFMFDIVGVVVVTSAEAARHDDGKIHVVACKYMDYDNPTVGSIFPKNMSNGNLENISNINTDTYITLIVPGTTTTSSSTYGSLMKEEYPWNTGELGDTDNYSCWYNDDFFHVSENVVIPSPYDTEISMISNTINGDNMLNGADNTDAIMEAVGHDDAECPPVYCCDVYRFGFLDWYLPSIKELLYYGARVETINNSLRLCGMIIDETNEYNILSSTVWKNGSRNGLWYMKNRMYAGRDDGSSFGRNHFVLAFASY